MLKEKIDRLVKLDDLMGRVEEVFEKKSGWKAEDVKSTLQDFSKLDRTNQLLLGGLLVGQAILGRPLSGSKAVDTAKPKAPSAQE